MYRQNIDIDEIISKITGKRYVPRHCVRIVNPKQAAMYALHGLELIDIYPSRDYRTDAPIWVFVFDKKSSYEAYKAWCDYELDNDRAPTGSDESGCRIEYDNLD